METEDEIVLKAVAVVNAMIDDDSIGNSLKIAGDFFTPEQLALVTALLAGSRRDLQFDFTHSQVRVLSLSRRCGEEEARGRIAHPPPNPSQDLNV